MEFDNVYNDRERAEAYARLEFPGTYYLAYRDLPPIIAGHVRGTTALDFGCGTGRSTRFLHRLGFAAIGVDIADDMIKLARAKDPGGEYVLVKDGDLGHWRDKAFDLVLSVFTFDNIPTMQKKVALFTDLGNLLNEGGKIISLVSSPDIYTHEWASFTTRDFPENKFARSGDKVKIIMTDVTDRRPVEDIIWSDEDYRKVYEQAGLTLVHTCRPLAREDEPFTWVNETRIAPWVVYVLERP
jgi:SAM-dependent methyltransferase